MTLSRQSDVIWILVEEVPYEGLVLFDLNVEALFVDDQREVAGYPTRAAAEEAASRRAETRRAEAWPVRILEVQSE